MKSVLSALVLFLCATFVLSGQADQSIGDRFILSSSAAYLPHINPEINRTYKGTVLHQIFWDKKAMVSIHRSFYGGIRWLSIFTKGNSFVYNKEKEHYYIVGAFTEFDVLPQYQHRAYVRLAWNYGNYCLCGEEDPYKQDGLHYPSIAIGAEYYFTKQLAISVEGENLLTLPRSLKADNFVSYGIGLNYSISGAKK